MTAKKKKPEPHFAYAVIKLLHVAEWLSRNNPEMGYPKSGRKGTLEQWEAR